MELKAIVSEQSGLENAKDEEIINLHEAMVVEIGNNFGDAYRQDELYKRPSIYLKESQQWIMYYYARYVCLHCIFMKNII